MADFALQRKNMVESQVRPSDVTDRRIMNALLAVPREDFVPQTVRSLAYMDGSVRLTAASLKGGAERALMEPRLFARLLDLAAIEPQHRVLIVGAGSGYSAAVLQRLAAEVVALESDSELAASAAKALANLKGTPVQVVTGPLNAGWAKAAPYDVIFVEGSISQVPEALLQQLKEGGVLVAVYTELKPGKATLWKRYVNSFQQRAAFDAAAPKLPGFEVAVQFRL